MTIANLPVIFGSPEGEQGEAQARARLMPEGAKELGVAEAMRLGVELHRDGRLEGARTVYERVLEALPDHADALAMLGVVEHQLARHDRAIELLCQAIERVPDFMGFHLNLGNVLVGCMRLDDALKAYRRAIELAPDHPDLHNNVGAVLQAQRRHEEAAAAFERALDLEPNHVRTWNNIGLLYESRGQIKESIRAYLRALELAPGHGASAVQLGRAFHKLGQRDKAIEVFRQWSAMYPEDPAARHMLAAMSGEDRPERASDAYIEQQFDSFAASFEHVLNERLEYRAPQLCAAMLRACVGEPQAELVLLDLGCGTGLVGPLIAPWAGRLVGVDLSGGMLLRARDKGVYDELVKRELTAYLDETPAAWDAAVCADTFCYFGDLHAAMLSAARSLRPGAVLVYTVEALADDSSLEPELQYHGRYAHGRAHLEHAAAAAGLEMLAIRRETLRNEGGEPVLGWLVAVRRPA